MREDELQAREYDEFCNDLLPCFLHFIAMAGIESGTSSILDLPSWEGSKRFYLLRFLVDQSSYIVLGVLIFNALFFGIILDTFSEMRSAANTRSKIYIFFLFSFKKNIF